MIAQAAGGTDQRHRRAATGRRSSPASRFGDTGTGMLMAITILGALRKRDRTGQGRRLQVAMQDAMLHYMRTNFAHPGAHRQAGAARRRPGRPAATTRRSGLYPCKPGGPNDYVYIMTSRANPEHWDAPAAS